jgi:hypothetical protein
VGSDSSPRRHDWSQRSRRKAHLQTERVLRELEYLRARLQRLDSHFGYAIRKALKLRNRLK